MFVAISSVEFDASVADREGSTTLAGALGELMEMGTWVLKASLR